MCTEHGNKIFTDIRADMGWYCALSPQVWIAPMFDLLNGVACPFIFPIEERQILQKHLFLFCKSSQNTFLKKKLHLYFGFNEWHKEFFSMLFHSRYVPGLITSDWLHIHTKQVQLDANSVIFINRAIDFIIHNYH